MNAAPEVTRLLTLAEAAPMLRKSEASLRSWLRDPECPLIPRRIGRRIFLRQSDVELVSGVTAMGDSTDRSYDDGYQAGYRAALADMRKALNGFDR